MHKLMNKMDGFTQKKQIRNSKPENYFNREKNTTAMQTIFKHQQYQLMFYQVDCNENIL